MEENKDRPIIYFEHADIYNSGNLVISDLNMSVRKGEFVYIVGKVGSGKTTVIRSMIGDADIKSGTALVGEFNLRKLKKRQIPYLRRKLGVIFQDFQLLMDRSAYDNLAFVLRATGVKDKKAVRNRINTVLEAVGMETKSHKMPHQLSGGEQQRIAIARALLNNPEIILADEPTGNLDGDTTEEIMNLLMRIHSRENGPAIIMVTHNKSLFQKYPARTFICEKLSCTEAPEESDIQLDLSEFI
ncbi:MAG TPA: ATP-binding cassette domain-containing protein [Candidatus Coprenecus stercoravium]|uniref:Cell division ATP-binding protein FtsE n=1 Tax=Candidatus Coprenecus stercoravium TaxID=2840735 RepID=A0A9D2GQE1_9BACT|nr:ATP-binding cassette domain-containing protein [Candidatus Coprenecus stercoravium]